MFSLLYKNQNFRTQIDPAEEPTSPADSVATLLPDDFEMIPVEPEGHEETAKDTMTTEEKEKKLTAACKLVHVFCFMFKPPWLYTHVVSCETD